MEHLSPETLARLVGETPSQDEQRHLSGCEPCAAELEALREQAEALGRLPDVRPPRGDWAVLEARLSSEGLLRTDRGFMALASTPRWMKTAAAVLLFLGGTGLGAGLTSRGALPSLAGTGGNPPYTLVSTSAATLEEAEAAVHLAERRYRDALVQYRQLMEVEGSVGGNTDPESRLAALEYLVAAGQAAVQQAPADPFLNGFLASAMAERQVTRQAALRQADSADDWY